MEANLDERSDILDCLKEEVIEFWAETSGSEIKLRNWMTVYLNQFPCILLVSPLQFWMKMHQMKSRNMHICWIFMSAEYTIGLETCSVAAETS